ncbi:MAG TPA: hypothetical protein VF859_06455 [Burkholderiales bacterium]
MKRALLLLLIAATPALSQPPPGHPTPEQAAPYLGLPPAGPAAELSERGVVLEAIDANQYTYIEVLQGERSRWIAAPRVALAKGAVIRFDEGRMMTNFYSRKLRRTFETLMFVNRVVPVE